MTLRLALALSSAAMLAAGSNGAKAAKAPAETAWIQAPSFADVTAAYPAAAKAKGQVGEVVLSCAFGEAGRLSRCDTTAEAPKAAGFAEAARGLMGQFRGPAETPVGRRTRIAFKFALDQLEARSVGHPEWVAFPTPAQFQAVFPDAASKAGVLKAKAVMDCTVTAAGALADCRSVSEDPAGYGLGQAILPLGEAFRVKIWTADGLPVVGGVVRAPIRYDMKQAPPSAAKP